MTEDDTLVRARAQELLEAHGEGAEEEAQRRLRACMENGDVKTAGLWLAVLHEIGCTPRKENL